MLYYGILPIVLQDPPSIQEDDAQGNLADIVSESVLLGADSGAEWRIAEVIIAEIGIDRQRFP